MSLKIGALTLLPTFVLAAAVAHYKFDIEMPFAKNVIRAFAGVETAPVESVPKAKSVERSASNPSGLATYEESPAPAQK